jgi:two-component system, NtrC family, response regulator AtoC
METGGVTLAKQTLGILVVDDEKTLRYALREGLSEDGYRVETAGDLAEALAFLEREEYSLALLDQKLPDGSGLDLLKQIRQRFPDTQVVVMTAFGKFESAVEATKAGCFDYIAKPFELDHMKLVIKNALSQARLTEEVSRLRQSERRRAGSTLIVGGSSKLAKIFETIRRVASTGGNSTVLLQGETGVGKELLARMVHDLGALREGPFVEVNCSAIPEDLLESELFGHERGAFTDAKRGKKGLMELANGGTLFLDEIGEMSLAAQSKLLRALETKRFRRVGGASDLAVETRVLAATNRDLRALVEQAKFREDLFFRLDVIRIIVPPLRERPEDIPALIDHFVAHFNGELGRSVKGPSDRALELLMGYRWPGNVRELKNVIERAILLESEDVILPEHLPLEIVGAAGGGAAVLESRLKGEGTVMTLARAEQIAIEIALDRAGGNKTKAAEWLDISRQTLRTKLKEYRMESSGGHGG